MNATIRAAVLEDPALPLAIVDGIVAPPLAPGQILALVTYSGVCQSQLMEARGKRGADKFLPHLLGHEGAGIVEAIGEGVTKVKIGDPVILGWIRGAGADVPSTRYSHGGRTINAGAITTLNTRAVVSENRCVRTPEGVPDEIAALLGCAVLTGAGLIENDLQPAPNTSLAIMGLGGIGMSAVMAAALHPFTHVIAIDVSPEKLALAAALGATHTIDARESDPVQAVRALSGGGVDYAVEAAGFAHTIEQAFAMLKPRSGLCIFASHPAAGEKIQIDPHELISGKRIRGSWGGGANPDRDVPRFAALYREGRLPLEKLITRRYRLEEVNQALDDLEARRVMRPMIALDAAA